MQDQETKTGKSTMADAEAAAGGTYQQPEKGTAAGPGAPFADEDIMNRHGVSMHLASGEISLMLPPQPGQHMSKDRALALAAWLTVLAGDFNLERLNAAIAAIERQN